MSAKDIDLIGQKQINTENTKMQGLQAEAAALAEARRSSAASGQWLAEANARRAQKDLESLKLHYQLLLAKPMHQIAELSGDFKKTYEAQQLLMAEWMVSQKAFKELAIQYGMKAGKTAKEIIQEGFDKEIDVLEAKNNPEHNTNVDEDFEPYLEPMKKKYWSERKM